MTGKVYHLTDRNEFKQFLLTNKNFIIKFTATWCGPCKTAKPIIDNYFNQSKQYLDMVIVDVDKGHDLSSYFKIKSVPTMYSFINGEISESLVGANKDEILHFFKSTLKKKNTSVSSYT
ncbi:MAG: thiol reductase thioredoxin [Bdellovibrionaceae bacterium]|nr:thiol reductase thioredoxin [Pseudobdellovibrionaceae bacterium]|tara:strand:- start:12326 stop:12682 length:357 start_codon:yes stop_codon:yes gene_type:complete